jgi:D-alanyl-D-alanine carboxypeptidase
VSRAINFTVRLTSKDNNQIMAVVLGSATNESRFSEARDLANYVFEKYLWPNQEGYNDLLE